MYRKADWKGVKGDCKHLLAEEIITDDVTTSCNNVVGAILKAAEKNVTVSKPSKNPTRKPIPYWTEECIAVVKERNKANNKMQQIHDLTTDRQAYYKLKGVAQRVGKDAKKQHWRDYCNMLEKTLKIGRVRKMVKKMSGVATKKIDTDTQGGLLGVRQQPVQGRIVHKEVRQSKFKQQLFG